MTWQTWRAAMDGALYGPAGFYRRPAGPAAHFRTSVHASPLFAQAIARLANDLAVPDHQLTIVDVGAGRGELLRQLAPLLPRCRLVGVDVVERPADLPAGIGWRRGLAELEPVPLGLLVANEWLDNIALDVVQDGRLVEVDPTGAERPGCLPGERELAWLREWGAGADRTEIGWPRDDAWAQAVARLEVGLAVAIDYRLEPLRHGGGTLTGYRDGRQVPPVPDGSCDLTAHVLLESCARAAGGDALLLGQRAALSALGVSGQRPPRELASSSPADYLRALAGAGAAAELTDPAGLGGFGWLVQPRGLAMPDVFAGSGRTLG